MAEQDIRRAEALFNEAEGALCQGYRALQDFEAIKDETNTKLSIPLEVAQTLDDCFKKIFEHEGLAKGYLDKMHKIYNEYINSTPKPIRLMRGVTQGRSTNVSDPGDCGKPIC